MSESEIKHVTVALSHPDELNPRRRRRTRKFKEETESQAGGSASSGIVDVQGSNTGAQLVMVQKDIPVPTTTTGSATTIAPTPVIAISTTPTTTVNTTTPTPIVATTAVVGGARHTPGEPAAVHILKKKNNIQTHPTGEPGVGIPTPALNAPNAPKAPKIVPHKKRLTSAPVAQTMKKPKFIVSTPPPTTPTSNPTIETNNVVRGELGGNLKTAVGGSAPDGSKARKRFTERRIKIEVKPTIKTRKSKKILIERIDSMPIQAVRRLLLKKGVLKSKTTVPPESMLRSMLRDYYLLKQSE
jgi:hypothetical protein